MELFRLDTVHLQTGVLEAQVIRVFQVVLDDARMAVDGLGYQILTSNFPMLSNLFRCVLLHHFVENFLF